MKPSVASSARAAAFASASRAGRASLSALLAAMLLAVGAAGCGAPVQQASAPVEGWRATLNVPPGVPLEAALDAAAGRATKLLRFPDIHGDLVVFTYAGDLWLARTAGGTASRLTSHPGLELFPKFSPDGQWIAFTGQYDGGEQVYVVSVGGGTPLQLTYYPARGPLPARWGYDNQVYGWTPNGDAVLFRSLRDTFDLGESRLYTVPASGGAPTPLPMPMSGAGDLSPDGRKVVYSPLFRDFRTWKRYAGGWAQDLYVFDIDQTTARRITNDPRADRDPMWIGDAIYFNSERSGTSNLYRYTLASDAVEPVTEHRDWDVRWPSADAEGHIVYELDGGLHVLDTKSGADRALEIYVPNDGTSARPELVSAAKNIEDFELSPKGSRALFVARGDVFTAPVEHGLVRNLTHSSGAHDREASWSPDGEHIVYVSDNTGEQELWVIDHRGQEPARQLTSGTRAHLYRPRWSPDGRRIAYSDQQGKIYVVPAAGGKSVEVADEIFGRTADYAWSPDGQFLAFSLNDPTTLSSIYIWSARDGQTRRVTGPDFNEYGPAWHPNGEHLYYLSQREFQPQIDVNEWNFAQNRGTVILALALTNDAANPFGPRNDEIGAGGDKDKDKDSDKGGDKSLPKVRIDFDGLADRVIRVPIEPNNYGGLRATDTHLVYGQGDAFFYGREATVPPVLKAYSIADRKEVEVAAEIQGYSLSADGKKVLVRKKSGYEVLAVGAPGGGGKPGEDTKRIAVDKLMMQRVPALEWAEAFSEVWRRYRDYFYVANMHGYDWEALRAKYEPLLVHVGHRSDLNYVIGEMIAELNVSHAYIAGGDEKLPERPNVALLGARFELDAGPGRYRVARIFAGQNAEPRYRSPLTEVGAGVGVGDYILAINGQDLRAGTNPYQLLTVAPGQPVELLVNSRPVTSGARTVVVDPISSETDLIYLGWVRNNRRKVTEATNGRVGYLHIPDMGADGIREFIKWYYGQVRKEGLIIDVRGNGGGNVSQMLIERLRRTLMGVDFARNQEVPTTYPAVVFHGHMVTLISETSASDGDIFPYMFRQAGLGPLIGKRTWGGIVGISFHGPLIDGGQVFVPEFGNAAASGEWVVEGVGVPPDIEVENDPVSLIEGRDPQLERGIAEVMKRIEAEPRRLPARPAPPVKTPEAMQPAAVRPAKAPAATKPAAPAEAPTPSEPAEAAEPTPAE
ncbi:S41 family peptidase [Haliangium sp.]|uniref:S41 family peptidase n=2 Tax=Haliangium sp. TaxID=2663208 RepID=UPI003D0EB3B7